MHAPFPSYPQLFPGIQPPENFSDRYVYKVPLELIKDLSQVFSEIQNAKEELNIEDYSFSQATLEQVSIAYLSLYAGAVLVDLGGIIITSIL